MSVYRHLYAADLDAIRRAVGVDALGQPRPIIAGIENSNWFLTLRGKPDRQVVLSVLEVLTAAELPHLIAVTDALAAAGLPVPSALRLANDARYLLIQGHPALLVPRLRGAHVKHASPAQCTAAGAMLARIHRAGSNAPVPRRARDCDWWLPTFAALAPTLATDVRNELEAALADATQTFAACDTLPQGLIHGDYFRDNVLFDGNEIVGVLDFFHAAQDLFAWDLAIALNDWTMADGQPDAERASFMLAGYDDLRALGPEERAALPALRRAAAARFWLSRLLFSRQQAKTGQRKDPEEMRAWWRALR